MVQASNSVDLGSAVTYAVMKKSQDSAEKQGEAMVSLIKDAVAVASRGAVSATPSPAETGRNLSVEA